MSFAWFTSKHSRPPFSGQFSTPIPARSDLNFCILSTNENCFSEKKKKIVKSYNYVVVSTVTSEQLAELLPGASTTINDVIITFNIV